MQDPAGHGDFLVHDNLPEVDSFQLLPCEMRGIEGVSDSPLKRRLPEHSMGDEEKFAMEQTHPEYPLIEEPGSRKQARVAFNFYEPVPADASCATDPPIQQTKPRSKFGGIIPRGTARFKATTPDPRALSVRRRLGHELANVNNKLKSYSNAVKLLYEGMEYFPQTIHDITKVFDRSERPSANGGKISMHDAFILVAMKNGEMDPKRLQEIELSLNADSVKRLVSLFSSHSTSDAKLALTGESERQIDDVIRNMCGERIPKPVQRSWKDHLQQPTASALQMTSADAKLPCEGLASDPALEETLRQIHETGVADFGTGSTLTSLDAITRASLMTPHVARRYLDSLDMRTRDRIELLFKRYTASLTNPSASVIGYVPTALSNALVQGNRIQVVQELRDHLDAATAPIMLPLVNFDPSRNLLDDIIEYCRPRFLEIDTRSADRHLQRAIALKDIIKDKLLFFHHMDALPADDRILLLACCAEMYKDDIDVQTLYQRVICPPADADPMPPVDDIGDHYMGNATLQAEPHAYEGIAARVHEPPADRELSLSQASLDLANNALVPQLPFERMHSPDTAAPPQAEPPAPKQECTFEEDEEFADVREAQ